MRGTSTSAKPAKYSVVSHAVEILNQAGLQDMANLLNNLESLLPPAERKDAENVAFTIVSLNEASPTLITRANIALFNMPADKQESSRWWWPSDNVINRIAHLFKNLEQEFVNQATFDCLYSHKNYHMVWGLEELLKSGLLDANNFRWLRQHPQHFKGIACALAKLGGRDPKLINQDNFECLKVHSEVALKIAEFFENPINDTNQANFNKIISRIEQDEKQQAKYYAVMFSQGLRDSSNPIHGFNRDLVAKIAAFFSACPRTQGELAPYIRTVPLASSNKQQSISKPEETKSQVLPEASSLSLMPEEKATPRNLQEVRAARLVYLTRSGFLSSSSASQNPAQSVEENVATNQNTDQATTLIFRQRVRGG